MPLLFETKSYKLTRPNVLVACSDEQQVSACHVDWNLLKGLATRAGGLEPALCQVNVEA